MNLEKFGFRKDYNPSIKFHLITKIKEFTISTVDLGYNVQLDDNLPPLYYETMIFNWVNTNDNPFEFYQERYTTLKDAIDGHKKTIDNVLNYLEGIDKNEKD